MSQYNFILHLIGSPYIKFYTLCRYKKFRCVTPNNNGRDRRFEPN